MIIKHAKQVEVMEALNIVNTKFDNNVIFNRFEQKGNNFHVTLKVKNSRGKGARLGFTGRHLINACWHVHGEFFDALFSINPEIIVVSQGKKITINEGNWKDRNIGSMMNPLYYSEACEC